MKTLKSCFSASCMSPSFTRLVLMCMTSHLAVRKSRSAQDAGNVAIRRQCAAMQCEAVHNFLCRLRIRLFELPVMSPSFTRLVPMYMTSHLAVRRSKCVQDAGYIAIKRAWRYCGQVRHKESAAATNFCAAGVCLHVRVAKRMRVAGHAGAQACLPRRRCICCAELCPCHAARCADIHSFGQAQQGYGSAAVRSEEFNISGRMQFQLLDWASTPRWHAGHWP